jgi:protein phosphatase 2C family protein 2/3
MEPILKDNYVNNKFPLKQRNTLESVKILDKLPKKNLPELKLTKIKIRPGSDPEVEPNKQNFQNKIGIKTGIKYTPLIPRIQKNLPQIKKTELMFPKIKSGTNTIYNDHNLIVTNFTSNNFLSNNNNNNNTNSSKASSKRKNIRSTRNSKVKTFYGPYEVNKNNIPKSNQIQNRNFLYQKVGDTEKNNLENNQNKFYSNNFNYLVNLQRVNPKMSRYPRYNKSMPSTRVTTKIKKIKNEQKDKHIGDSLTINSLTNYPKNQNFLGTNNKGISNELNNKNNNLIPTASLNKPNSILNSLKPTPTSLPTTNSFLEIESMTERLNILHNLFNSLSTLTGGPNPFLDINQPQKTVELSPEIYKNTYKNYIPSITSSHEDFTETDIIKGFAYNSSMGNIRDYNEDTITASKLTLNNGDDYYFFGVYDGHGGNGCSLYLKNYLHKYVKEFSKESIKEAINEAEEKFIKDHALNEKGEIMDQSGSCGIMAMIQKNKCIIANVGDSRLVIYKNNSIFFCTEDHKPGSDIEKERITKAGGKIYQTPSLWPLYQNGKEIEIPWRVLPGRLSVSRTFGDIEAKDEKFGGNKNVVVALPDITEIELNEDFNLIVLGCDGIFDVLSNEEILECIKIVLKEKNINEITEETNISELCGEFAGMIIKSALAKDSFDNVSCIVIAINIKDLIK